jgi:hypothetical protein
MKARDFYYLGLFHEACKLNSSKNDAIYVIASLVFTGKHNRARNLYKEKKKYFNHSGLIFCRFHLGISYTRTSEYSKSRECFLENFKLRHYKKNKGEDLILIFQGLSFYRYFFSRHQSSLYFARKAEDCFLKINCEKKLYGALVMDIISHNYYQLGEPSKGKKYSEYSLKLAEEGELKTFRYEFNASKEIYESEYNPNVNENIKKLKKVFETTPETNDYTLSEIILQISKQYLLKGNYKEANDTLKKNYGLVYKNDNKRKVAKLNTLLAQIMIYKQQFIEALSLLKIAKSHLDREIDLSLLSPIVGLEKKCLKYLQENYDEQNQELLRIIKVTDKAIIHQECTRYDLGDVVVNGQDRLSELFNSASMKDISVIDEVIHYQLFHLIRLFLPRVNKKQVILVHPRGKGLFTIDEDVIIYNKSTLSSNQLQALLYLQNSGFTKKEFVKVVWGYENYEPFRHDHLVYSLIKTLRKSLGIRGEWIRSNGEDWYYLDENTEIICESKAKFKKDINNFKVKSLSINRDLNFRQIQILNGIFSTPFSAGDASKLFEINRMTAFRDLNDLVEKGLIEKRGRYKGTKYSVY